MVGAWFLSHQVLLKLRIWGQARRGGNARTRGICFRSCLPVQPYWMRTAENRFPAFLSGNSTQGVPIKLEDSRILPCTLSRPRYAGCCAPQGGSRLEAGL